jgi:predicted small metal-binding protein
MKTMTCSQLGGACALAHAGDDANEIIKAQDRHLREVVAAGDTEHEPALRDMKGRWRRPVSGMKWYRKVQRDFAALPVDTESR